MAPSICVLDCLLNLYLLNPRHSRGILRRFCCSVSIVSHNLHMLSNALVTLVICRGGGGRSSVVRALLLCKGMMEGSVAARRQRSSTAHGTAPISEPWSVCQGIKRSHALNHSHPSRATDRVCTSQEVLWHRSLIFASGY